MKKRCLSAWALAMLWAGPAMADAAGPARDPLLGKWRTSQGSIIEMYACRENRVCGRLLYSPKSRMEDGSLRPSAFDAAQPMCGAQIVFDLSRDGAAMWKGGTVLDVEKGRKASVRVRLKEQNTAEARFYKGITLLGVTEVLTRTQEPAPPC